MRQKAQASKIDQRMRMQQGDGVICRSQRKRGEGWMEKNKDRQAKEGNEGNEDKYV
jgi:hypothetical protein